MLKKYRALKITTKGVVTTENDISIVCPVSSKHCTCRCAWYSNEDNIIRCQDIVIGAIRGEPVKSFRLSKGPQVYDSYRPIDIGLDEKEEN